MFYALKVSMKKEETTTNYKTFDKIEDQIEFFGFIPFAFVRSFTEELEKILDESCQHKEYKHLRPKLFSLFNKNMLIFNNYVLRNIFTFEEEFKWERKKTDKVIDVDINKEAKELIELQKLHESKTNLLEAKTYELIEVENKNKGLKTTLANTPYIERAEELLNELETEVNDMQNKYAIYSGVFKQNAQKQIKKFMEHKYMKSEYFKEEKKRLFKIAKTEDLENLCKKMQF